MSESGNAVISGEEVMPGDMEALESMCATLQERPHLAASLAQWMIPDLCPAPARAITDKRYTGVLIKNNVDRGFGFISCPEVRETYGCDVWVHHMQLGNYGLHDTVSFALLLNKELRPQAFDVSAPDAGKGQSKDGGKGKNVWVPSSGKASWGKGDSKGDGWSSDGWSGDVWAAAPQAAAGNKRTWDAANGGSQERYTGSIIQRHAEKGYGFISCPEIYSQFGKDTWLHKAQFAGFDVGDTVEFTMIVNSGGTPQAIDLTAASSAKKAGVIVVRPGQAPAEKQPVKVAPPPRGKAAASDGYGGGGGKGWGDERRVGKIKSFLSERGFGFIECQEVQELFGKEVWLHHKQVKEFNVGDEVSFTLILNGAGQPQGIDLEAV